MKGLKMIRRKMTVTNCVSRPRVQASTQNKHTFVVETAVLIQDRAFGRFEDVEDRDAQADVGDDLVIEADRNRASERGRQEQQQREAGAERQDRKRAVGTQPPVRPSKEL